MFSQNEDGIGRFYEVLSVKPTKDGVDIEDWAVSFRQRLKGHTGELPLQTLTVKEVGLSNLAFG